MADTDIMGVDIRGIIGAVVGPLVKPAILLKKATSTRIAGELTGGNQPVVTEHKCRGFVETRVRRNRKDSTVRETARVIVLIGDTLGAVEPEPQDRITIEGVTSTIVAKGVARDPASATYTCTTE